MDQGAFGSRLGRAFRQTDPSTLVTQTRRNRRLAATEIRHDAPGFGASSPLAVEHAYLVGLQRQDCPAHGLSLDGRPVSTRPLAAGEVVILDLRERPTVEHAGPFHTIYFYLPRAAFDEVADEAAVPRIGGLQFEPNVGVADSVLANMAAALAPSFAAPAAASRLLVDHVLRAVCTHVAHTYGGMPSQAPRRGGLAPWQERRAKELLTARIDGEITLAELAQECDLSVSHFTRAFRRSTGLPPYGWLIAKRVERAKELLADSSLPLAELALAAGFADQSHLTRSFKRQVGTTPGSWRRMSHA